MKDVFTLHLPLINNLSDYTLYLRGQVISKVLTDSINLEGELINSVIRLLKTKFAVYRCIYDTRSIIEYTCNKWIGKSIKAVFPLYTREMAYMTDDGILCISLYFLFTSSGYRVLKILLHELAHWWIAQQNGYERLLMLDREYLALYGTAGEYHLLSPIEYFATIVSIELMRGLSSALDSVQKRLLVLMAEDEQRRVKTAILSLCL